MKKLTNELKMEVLERFRKGQESEHISLVMEVELWKIEELSVYYWKNRLKESNKIIAFLKDQLKGKEVLSNQNRELRDTIRNLNAQIASMRPAIDSVNRLSAERSKLIRKLKKAGIKI